MNIIIHHDVWPDYLATLPPLKIFFLGSRRFPWPRRIEVGGRAPCAPRGDATARFMAINTSICVCGLCSFTENLQSSPDLLQLDLRGGASQRNEEETERKRRRKRKGKGNEGSKRKGGQKHPRINFYSDGFEKHAFLCNSRHDLAFYLALLLLL